MHSIVLLSLRLLQGVHRLHAVTRGALKTALAVGTMMVVEDPCHTVVLLYRELTGVLIEVTVAEVLVVLWLAIVRRLLLLLRVHELLAVPLLWRLAMRSSWLRSLMLRRECLIRSWIILLLWLWGQLLRCRLRLAPMWG